jgi:hypothetical protein
VSSSLEDLADDDGRIKHLHTVGHPVLKESGDVLESTWL